jgi:hypothetical protein
MDLRDVPATLATKQGVAIGGRLLAAAGSLDAGIPAVAGFPAATFQYALSIMHLQKCDQ